VQLDSNLRPPIKCYDPEHSKNPITCDSDDIAPDNAGRLPKDEMGFTPVKYIPGGPNVKGIL